MKEIQSQQCSEIKIGTNEMWSYQWGQSEKGGSWHEFWAASIVKWAELGPVEIIVVLTKMYVYGCTCVNMYKL